MRPVFANETLDAFELSTVGGDPYQIPGAGLPGDQQVVRTDRLSRRRKFAAHRACRACIPGVERNDLELQPVQQLKIAVRMPALAGTAIEPIRNRGGQPNIGGRKTV